MHELSPVNSNRKHGSQLCVDTSNLKNVALTFLCIFYENFNSRCRCCLLLLQWSMCLSPIIYSHLYPCCSSSLHVALASNKIISSQQKHDL
ncbi:unnamed protein product [Ixodes pacificus]